MGLHSGERRVAQVRYCWYSARLIEPWGRALLRQLFAVPLVLAVCRAGCVVCVVCAICAARMMRRPYCLSICCAVCLLRVWCVRYVSRGVVVSSVCGVDCTRDA